MPSVCFVCLGNICRSPMAHALALHQLDEAGVLDDWEIDSCGTGGWHVGNPADPRTMAVLRKNGVSYQHRARQLQRADYTSFDWLLAMDDDNAATLRDRAPSNATARIALLVDWDPHGAPDVPDPYYGGDAGFDRVYDLVDRSLRGFFA